MRFWTFKFRGEVEALEINKLIASIKHWGQTIKDLGFQR